MNFKKAFAYGKIRAAKVAPHAMLVIGIGGIIYTVISTAMKARKLDDTLEEELQEVEAAENELKEMEEAGCNEEAMADAKARLKRAKFVVIKKGIKVFIIPTLVGIASIVLIVSSHAILTNKLTIASTTLAAVEAKFKDYRQGVKEKYGEEVDKEIAYGRHETEKDARVIDGETGEEKDVKVMVSDWREGHSVYAMAFCKSYCGNMFADNQYYDTQTITNMLEMLKRDYDVYDVAKLSKAYDYMHHDITPEALKAGWVKGNPNGDGYIKVDVIPTVFEFKPGEFENGYILDFNVDGNIEHILPKPRMRGVPRLLDAKKVA